MSLFIDICNYVSTFVIIYRHLSLFIDICHYLSTFVIIYRHLSLFIDICHYLSFVIIYRKKIFISYVAITLESFSGTGRDDPRANAPVPCQEGLCPYTDYQQKSHHKVLRVGKSQRLETQILQASARR